MYFIYILKSQLDGSFYIGYSTNIEQRLLDHNAGKSRYTSKKIPWVLFYTESFHTKTEALKREKFLKSQRNKDFYNKLAG